MNKLIALTCFLIFPCILFAGDEINNSENRLFHVERSKNRNIVCYDVKIINNFLDKEPVDVYWINMEEKAGEKSGLSNLQKKLAFGYKLITKGSESADIALNACPNRKMKICKNGNKFECIIDICNQAAILQKIFVKTKDKNHIKVEYVELTGVNLASGELINEKIYN